MKRYMKTTKTNPKLNVRLLRRVKRHILAEPRRLFMSAVYTTKQLEGGSEVFDGDNGKQRFAACGTAACIAGWTLILSKKSLVSGGDGMTKAAHLLGMGSTHSYGVEAASLFHLCYWPDKFQKRYDAAKRSAGRARVAAARIEHFIKTGK